MAETSLGHFWISWRGFKRGRLRSHISCDIHAFRYVDARDSHLYVKGICETGNCGFERRNCMISIAGTLRRAMRVVSYATGFVSITTSTKAESQMEKCVWRHLHLCAASIACIIACVVRLCNRLQSSNTRNNCNAFRGLFHLAG
jgi:hypothetical protein